MTSHRGRHVYIALRAAPLETAIHPELSSFFSLPSLYTPSHLSAIQPLHDILFYYSPPCPSSASPLESGVPFYFLFTNGSPPIKYLIGHKIRASWQSRSSGMELNFHRNLLKNFRGTVSCQAFLLCGINRRINRRNMQTGSKHVSLMYNRCK